MRLRLALLAAVTAALFAPAAASAAATVKPAHRVGDQSAVAFMSELALQQSYTFQPSSPPPDPGPCRFSGQHRRALLFGGFDEELNTCTIRPSTQVIVQGAWAGCSSVEDPPFYGANAREQRACAIAARTFITGYEVSVDGAAPVDIVGPRYWIITPQLSFHLPADNLFDKPEQDGTAVAFTWMAEVHGLRPGRHVLTVHLSGPDFDHTGSRIIVVRPRA